MPYQPPDTFPEQPQSGGPDATADFYSALSDPTKLTRIGDGSRRYYGLYSCVCGNTKEIYDYSVRKGATTSCGCWNKENTTARNKRNLWGTKHGKHKTREYAIWVSMIQRCTNPKTPGFCNWGGRGIKVCDRWLTSFENFFGDMGRSPEGTSIDRVDNDGDYTPENCRWATRKQQLRNKRNNRVITFRGKSLCLSAWAEELGMHLATLINRIRRGWSVEDAFTRPVQHKGVSP